ncbi:LLM class flavin-dependent oxidoreductase [Leucobacter celer]|uniref:LLM class flavin-dependent oxidoreductase n=1 Tax=Leucobacter celer TaxID=668625 RepID=UPI0006A75FCE|nr:LLM class flavin-dependent oxidoreductase [Leucobacter celer]
MSATEFFVLFDGAYPRVPHASSRKSNFIDLPNTHYDDVDGQYALEYQLSMLKLVEELGYDGALLSEQHNGPIGLFGNPMLAGAWLAGQTSRIKIGITGPILNAYQTPVRLAEEIAALDIMSRGRLIIGLPVGHGMQYHSMGVVNVATARARYREAHDLLVAALTREGPFEWNGEFFQVPYVNLWPRPLQKPHPQIMLVGGGSLETLDLIAKHGYGYNPIGVTGIADTQKINGRLAELCRGYGYEPQRSQFWAGLNVHVAETDKQARLEVEAHELWVNQNFFPSPLHDSFPPGYLSEGAIRGLHGGASYRSKPISEIGYDDMIERGSLIAGSPETVTAKLQEYLEATGVGRLMFGSNNGSKPKWLAVKSLTLLAEEVLPKLRGGAGPIEPELLGYGSNAEYGAMRNRSTPPPTALLDGRMVDVDTAHIEELRAPSGE